MATISTSSYANFATMVGVYDSTLYGNIMVDTSTNFGSGDLILTAANQQYLLNNNNYVSPAAVADNGMTVTGWFYPSYTSPQTPSNAAIFNVNTSSTSPGGLYVGFSSLATAANPTLTASYNGTAITSIVIPPGNAVQMNTWNFYAYTVICNGTTATQYLYINGAVVGKGTNLTYSGSVTYNNTFIGYAPTRAYFNGKIDEFRFYTRALTLPELNVLYSYNYRPTSSSLTPSITTAALDPSYTFIAGQYPNPVVGLGVNGIFSYLAVQRAVTSGSTGTAASYNVSCSTLASQANYAGAIWTDVSSSLTAGNTYSYTLTPYILNLAGSSFQVSVTI